MHSCNIYLTSLFLNFIRNQLSRQYIGKGKQSDELIISPAVDITERKRDEEYFGHLAAIVESSDDAIISKSLDGIIISWNKGGEKMFGYTAEQALGKHISLIIPPEFRSRRAMSLS